MDSVIGQLAQVTAGKSIKNAARTATGGVEKAIIGICDNRNRDVTEVDNKPSLTNGIYSGLKSNVTEKLNTLAKNYIPSTVLSQLSSPDYGKDIKKFVVQFNPESLVINAKANEAVNQKSISDSRENITKAPEGADVVLDVTLIFDEVTDEAFADYSNYMQYAQADLRKSINTLAGSTKKRSVAAQVEGFISAISNENTRFVVFIWGGFSYQGMLRKIEAKYTMFAPDGSPVRAELGMSIDCFGYAGGMQDERFGAWKQPYDSFINL